MLQLRNLSLRRGPRLLLEGADLTVHPGQKLGRGGAEWVRQIEPLRPHPW